MDTGELLSIVRSRHGTTLQTDDPLLVSATINEVALDQATAKVRQMLDGTESGKTAGAVKELLAKVEDAAVDKLAQRAAPQIAGAIERAVDDKLREHFWNRLMLTSGMLLLAIFLVGGFCYWLGHSHGEAAVHQTEADLRAAFSGGMPGAATWRDLVKYNGGGIAQAVAQCEHLTTTTGQPACKVALWTGPQPSVGTKR